MSIRDEPKLFQLTRVGNMTLAHRVVLAPLTRFRADDAHTPTDLLVDYYAQRASVPGTLLITEATFVGARGGGFDHVPGIWNEVQVKAWKKVVDAVHARGSYIFMQIWAAGRVASPDILSRPSSASNPGGPYPYVAPSAIPVSSRPSVVPRELTHAEILEHIELYRKAVINAVHGAGFDGIEIHGAHGCLIDQFIQDVTNKRQDEWGGAIARRCKFALEVVKAVVESIGQERTAIRLSPWNTFMDMGMADPKPTFSYLVSQLRETYPRFAYLHVTEPRVAGSEDRKALQHESNDFLRAIWNAHGSADNGSPYIAAGGFTLEEAVEYVQNKGGLVAFGRHFISNPDLPARLRKNIPLNPYNRDTFYLNGSPKGYTDYGFADPEAEAIFQNKKEENI